MQFMILLTVAAVQAAAQSHPFQPAGSGDVRSPCPALNSLANHGFLPHNGKGISVPMVVSAFKDAMNVGADFISAAGALALQASPRLLSTTFDLNDVKQHNFPLEHDASLSRQDAFFNSGQTFNSDIWKQTLAHFDGLSNATIQAASDARWAREKDSLARNPNVHFGARQLVISFGETALYLSTLGDPISGNAPISFIRSLFENEKLPYDLGWTKPVQETNLATMGAMIAELQLANPDAVPEGLKLGTETLKDVLSLIDPLTHKPITAVCALLGLC